jgi:hypothetical protein
MAALEKLGYLGYLAEKDRKKICDVYNPLVPAVLADRWWLIADRAFSQTALESCLPAGPLFRRAVCEKA